MPCGYVGPYSSANSRLCHSEEHSDEESQAPEDRGFEIFRLAPLQARIASHAPRASRWLAQNDTREHGRMQRATFLSAGEALGPPTKKAPPKREELLGPALFYAAGWGVGGTAGALSARASLVASKGRPGQRGEAKEMARMRRLSSVSTSPTQVAAI